MASQGSQTQGDPEIRRGRDNISIGALTFLLAGLAMVGPFSIDTYLPSFPSIAGEYGVEPLLVQQTLSVYLFSFAAMMLFHGVLSDTFGRRPIVLWALVIYTLASLGAAFAPSFSWLLVFRAVQGASAGAGMVIGRAIVRDRLATAQAQRMLANMTMLFGVAPAIAPILGGFLESWFGWKAVFLFLSAFGLLNWIFCLRLLPETLPPPSRQPLNLKTILHNYATVLSRSRFRRLSLAVGLGFSGFGLYVASAPHFVLDILQLSETAFGWLFVPLIAGMVSGAWTLSRFVGRISSLKMIRIGYTLMTTAALLNVSYNWLWEPSLPWVVLPLTLYTFGQAWVTPNVTLQILDIFPRMRGMAASLQSFIQTLIFGLVAGLIAPMLFGGGLQLAMGGLIAVLLSMFCYWLAGPGEESEAVKDPAP